MRGAVARLVYHLLRIGIPFGDNLLIAFFRFGELLAYLLRVQLTFFNFSPSLFEHGKDRPVSESTQKERDDAEADHLRKKELPIPAEGLSRFAYNVGRASAGGNYHIHNLNLGRNTDCLPRHN